MQTIKRVGLKIAAGHSVEKLESIADGVVASYLVPKVYAQTMDLARTHLQRGDEVWIVTAAPTRLANALARHLGLTGALGTVVEEVDGYFTGELAGEPLHGPQKAIAVQALAVERNLDLSQCSAYSDSIHDLPMLTTVGNPNVVNADRALRMWARKHGARHYDFRKLRHARRYGGQALLLGLVTAVMRRLRPHK
jgi:HAD superfamily hydrolase (TIGR01490 family)